MLGVADDWARAAALRRQFSSSAAVDAAFARLAQTWEMRTSVFHARTGDPDVDRSINIWNPLNCQVSLERTRDISTDHMGVDGMRYRDTMQDALAVANFDPGFARERIRMVFAAQGRDGSGCFSFYPFSPKPIIHTAPRRSDNTVWPIWTRGQFGE